jgi:iron(III) transport system substrate-binding protein
MQRRQVLARAAALAAGAGFAHGAGAAVRVPTQAEWDKVLAAARKEGTVGFYSSGIARIEEPRMKQFDERFGLRVKYARPGGGEIVLKRLETELAAGKAPVDVCSVTDINLAYYAYKQGWTQSGPVPARAGIAAPFRREDDHLMPAGAITLPIIYNPKLVADADVPKTYEALADPRFKGKVVFGAPENASTTLAWIIATVERLGWGWVEKLRANDAAEMRLQAEAVLAVARGERALTVAAHSWGYFNNQQGAGLRYVFPADGVVSTLACVFMVRGAPNPNAGRVFIDTVMGGAWQASMMPHTGGYGTTVNVPSPPGLPPLAQLKLVTVPPERSLAVRSETLDRWRRIMGGARGG